MPVYRFIGRAVEQDRTGYYYARWDLSTDIEVLAANKVEANQKAGDMLGDPSRGRGWKYIWVWDKVIEEPNELIDAIDDGSA